MMRLGEVYGAIDPLRERSTEMGAARGQEAPRKSSREQPTEVGAARG
jgi:hypothetical protein